MAATYDITTNVGKVRLLIGDTDVFPETDATFTDAELTYFLTEHSDSINLAAADALEAWAAKYAANASTEKIGDYSYAQKTAENMLKLAQTLREKEAGAPALAWGEMDLTGEDTE